MDSEIKDICLEIPNRYEISFIENGIDLDPVNFLIQSVPTMNPSRLAQVIKRLTAREIFNRLPEVKKKLW